MRVIGPLSGILLGLALNGCGTIGLFGTYDLPESEDVSDAEWPRLVNVPAVPDQGTYTDAIPDPAIGIALETDLKQISEGATARAERLSEPVLTDADRAELLGE